MKKIPALLIIFVLLLQMCLFSVGAEEKKVITLTGMDYVSGTPAEIGKSNPYAMVRNSVTLGYTVDLPSEVMSIKIVYRTGQGEQGGFEVRKGGASGELLASVDTIALDNSVWADYTYVITLSEPIIGKNDIFVKGLSGSHWIVSLSFLPFDNSKRFVTYNLNDNFGDIENDANRHEINLLSDLGIVKQEEVEFNPGKFMSRVDFVSILGRVLETEKYADKTSPFKDVDIKDEDAAILSGLYQLGIIKGGTDGNFRAHDFITPLEAAIVCANALGYTKYKSALDVAYNLKLFKGVSLQSNTISRSDGVKIIYNLLLADYLSVNEMGEDFVIYNPTKNFVEKSSKYAHGKGVMTANNVTELYLRKNRDTLVIDGNEYLADNFITVDFLGMNCEFFYREENGEKILCAIRPLPKTEVNVIETDKNIRFDEISDKKIVYTHINEDEEIEYELDSNTAIIYNATAITRRLSKLIPDSEEFEGRITTVDNDGDGILEAIWIDHISQTIKVEAVAGTKIKDKFTQTFFDTAEGEFTCFVEDRTAGLDELSKGDVLSIYESSDTGKNKITRAIKNEDKKSGTVTMVEDDIYTIDGGKYKISSKCGDDIYLGFTGTVILNQYGQIISCIEGEFTENRIGALLSYDQPQPSSLSTVAMVKLLTENGIKIFNVANRITADGVLIKNADDFYSGAGLFVGIENVAVKTPVIYRLNAADEISMIDTVEDGAKTEDDKLYCFVAENANEEGGYRFRSDTFITKDTYKAKYGASSSIKYITISPDKEENSKITNGYVGSIHTPRALGIYSTKGESMITDLVISSGVATRAYDDTTKPFMFKSVSLRVNADGDTAHYINGISCSSEVSYEVDADSYSTLKPLIDSLEEGNLIDGTLKNSKLVSLSLVYIPNATDIKEFGPVANAAGQPTLLNVNARSIDYDDNDDATNKERLYYLARVVEIEENFMKLNRQIEGEQPGEWIDNKTLYNAGSAKIALVERTQVGRYIITNNLTMASLVKDDIVVAINTGGGGESLSSIYVFRDSGR